MMVLVGQTERDALSRLVTLTIHQLHLIDLRINIKKEIEMANTFKLVTKAGVTSADVIYTVAGSTTTVVLGIMLGNTTTSQITATVTMNQIHQTDLVRTMRQTKMSSW